jgi:hypothetical protein
MSCSHVHSTKVELLLSHCHRRDIRTPSNKEPETKENTV